MVSVPTWLLAIGLISLMVCVSYIEKQRSQIRKEKRSFTDLLGKVVEIFELKNLDDCSSKEKELYIELKISGLIPKRNFKLSQQNSLTKEDYICIELAKHFLEKTYSNLTNSEKVLFENLIQAGYIHQELIYDGNS